MCSKGICVGFVKRAIYRFKKLLYLHSSKVFAK
jgi:hypothetical protein